MNDLFSYLNFSEFSINSAFIFSVFNFYGCVTNCHKVSGSNICIYYITICEDKESQSGLASSSAQGLPRL